MTGAGRWIRAARAVRVESSIRIPALANAVATISSAASSDARVGRTTDGAKNSPTQSVPAIIDSDATARPSTLPD